MSAKINRTETNKSSEYIYDVKQKNHFMYSKPQIKNEDFK